MIHQRICLQCRRDLPLSDYSSYPSQGTSTKCRDCVADRTRKGRIRLQKEKITKRKAQVTRFEEHCRKDPKKDPEYLALFLFGFDPRVRLRDAQIGLLWMITRPPGRTLQNHFKRHIAWGWPGDDKGTAMLEELAPDQGPFVTLKSIRPQGWSPEGHSRPPSRTYEHCRPPSIRPPAVMSMSDFLKGS